jgi:hypothetical protein
MKVSIIISSLILMLAISSCKNKHLSSPLFETITSNKSAGGTEMTITFYKGPAHNYPTFSFWVEDLEGNYIETLFVTRYLASGIYGHGSLGEGRWDNKPGEAKRPATLPYWLHKRGVKADGETYLPTPEQPIADAISGATPQNNFILKTSTKQQLPAKFRLMMEINQPWDWNEFWHNNLYPNDPDYKTSCQPALVYAVMVDQNKPDANYHLNPIGHSHFAGRDGNLYTDLTTFTSAKQIAHKVTVSIKNN